jgi:hypothetical protein
LSKRVVFKKKIMLFAMMKQFLNHFQVSEQSFGRS